MGISKAQLESDLDALAAREPAIERALGHIGYPQARSRPRGHQTLLRTIVGQQVSVKAADTIWGRFADCVAIDDPATILSASEAHLRGAGLSGQKVSYVRSLAAAVETGAIDFDALPCDDAEAIAQLTAIKGIGRWSAEVYLLFAEGRRDIWPAGDLAVLIAFGEIMGLEARPREKQARELAENWSPWRGAAAILMWHHYNTDVI